MPERVQIMYRHVLLDFDRTLNDSDYVYEKNLDDFLGLSGQQVLQNWEEIHRRIVSKEPRERHQDLDHHYKLMLEQWSADDPESIREELKQRIKAAQEECWYATALFEESIPFLKGLKTAGHTVHIATGDYAVLKAEKIEEQAGQGIFDSKFDEGIVGIGKGSSAYFARAIKQLGVEPHQAVVIGDSLVNDIIPAARVGIPNIWIRRKNEKLLSTAKPDLTVGSLTEAMGIPIPAGKDKGWWFWRRRSERISLTGSQ
ncbi:HAD family hydrolase [Dehalococcoidia bacterium]|nr:HAD family hydrolase [Dehalococcoidia bacterium]